MEAIVRKLIKKKTLQAITTSLAVLVIVFAVGCQQQEEPVETAEPTEQPPDPAHNARNSLDYEGIYKGEIPTPNGILQETVIELKDDGTVIKTTKEPGQAEESGFEVFAAYSWNQEGNIITIDALPQPNSYFVAEGYLVHLDEEKSQIKDGLEDVEEDYILRKQ